VPDAVQILVTLVWSLSFLALHFFFSLFLWEHIGAGDSVVAPSSVSGDAADPSFVESLWVLRARWGWPVVGALALFAAGVGNVAAGENVGYRFPGPYQFGTDTRSQTAELHQLASWVRDNLPHGAKVVTDRFTGEVITSETTLDVPNPEESRAYGLYREGDDASPSLHAFLAQHDFRYWILDTRLVTEAPAGKLFEGYKGPDSVNPAALAGLGDSSFLTAEYRSAHYVVLVIAP